MLDPTLAYSCAYFGRGAKALAQAQLDKYELICQKLRLEPGMQVLDVGCGWGGLAAHMTQKYRVHVVGVTISEEQKALIEARHKDVFEVYAMDYRDLPSKFAGRFDRIVSVGMFEHVGPKNHAPYRHAIDACLVQNGLFLLHTIGGSGRPDAWIHANVFPNGVLPSERQITRAFSDRFVVRDWHNFGADYDRTLMAWYTNCLSARRRLPRDRYDERFWRFWGLYLQMCAGGFRAGAQQLWQIVLAKRGEHVDYRSVR
jgi:cyclopropane-fatty-acyl-phospholipid synthase